KHSPPTPYAAKFSTPFCMAVGFFDRRAGFHQFTQARIHDQALLSFARKIRYQIDPENPYPAAFTGHIHATLTDGNGMETDKAHMRGGEEEQRSAAEIQQKFVDNANYGGWSKEDARRAGAWCAGLFDPGSIAELAGFRH